MAGAGESILVVDDDEAIRELLTRRLAGTGYRTEAAAHGGEALDRLARGGVDLVVLDIMMPGLDGYSVLRRIREQLSPTALPVIMLSAKDKSPDVIEALRAGANDYAVKPIDWAVLEKRIAVHLALREGAGNFVGPYRLHHKLGAGGMGDVFAATEIQSGREVALKVLPRSLSIHDSYIERFWREADFATRVVHKNLVAVYKAGRDGETYYIAMELVRGHNLAQLRKDAPLELSAAVGIVRQVTAALSALHQAGVVHRDIKPENVMVADDGVVKLADFGIAYDMHEASRMTRTGEGVGSITFSAPEQMRGEVSFASDLYSLGCTFYYLLTGVDPFDSRQGVEAVLRQKQRGGPRPSSRAPGLPVAVDALVRRLMHPRPRRRPRSCAELDGELAALLALPRARPPALHRAAWGVVACGVVLTLALAWALLP